MAINAWLLCDRVNCGWFRMLDIHGLCGPLNIISWMHYTVENNDRTQKRYAKLIRFSWTLVFRIIKDTWTRYVVTANVHSFVFCYETCTNILWEEKKLHFFRLELTNNEHVCSYPNECHEKTFPSEKDKLAVQIYTNKEQVNKNMNCSCWLTTLSETNEYIYFSFYFSVLKDSTWQIWDAFWKPCINLLVWKEEE